MNRREMLATSVAAAVPLIGAGVVACNEKHLPVLQFEDGRLLTQLPPFFRGKKFAKVGDCYQRSILVWVDQKDAIWDADESRLVWGQIRVVHEFCEGDSYYMVEVTPESCVVAAPHHMGDFGDITSGQEYEPDAEETRLIAAHEDRADIESVAFRLRHGNITPQEAIDILNKVRAKPKPPKNEKLAEQLCQVSKQPNALARAKKLLQGS